MSALERRPMLTGRLRLSFVRRERDAWHELAADTSNGVVTIGIKMAELRPLVAAMLKTVVGSLPGELRERAQKIIAHLGGAAS